MKPAVLHNNFFGANVEGAYTTDANKNGNIYMMKKWKVGERPVETFDKKDWIGCAHGCVLGLLLLQDPARTQRAVEDDGIIHELIHIMHFPNSHEELGKYPSIQTLRDDIYQLQEDAIGAYESVVKQSAELTEQSNREYNERQAQYQSRVIGYNNPLLDPDRERTRRFYFTPLTPAFEPITTYKRGPDPFKPDDFKIEFNSELKTAAEDELKRAEKVREGFYGWKGSFDNEGASPIVVHTGEPVHQQVLQRTGQEEASASASGSEANGPEHIRSGDVG